MPKFITETELNHEITKLFKEAEKTLLIVSPYIKLHPHIQSALKSKKSNPELKVSLLFGKNKENPALSLRQEDLQFFMDFPNVEIRYNEHLHAKYYANELDGILTSMNLHSFSQDHNIEFGILMKANFVKDIFSSVIGSTSLDGDAWRFFHETLDQSQIIFQKEAQFEAPRIGWTKTYLRSVILKDETKLFFQDAPAESATHRRNKPTGYCIRTGKAIPFNPERPLCEEAYNSWVKFSNPDYPEKFCHFSGEPSNGETTFGRPILRKNWTIAKQTHGLK